MLTLQQRDDLMREVQRRAHDVAELAISAARFPRISFDALVKARESLALAIQAAAELDEE